MAEFMKSLAVDVTADVPCTLHYACKAIETKEGEVRRSTGWDTFLQVVINAGMQVRRYWCATADRTGSHQHRDASQRNMAYAHRATQTNPRHRFQRAGILDHPGLSAAFLSPPYSLLRSEFLASLRQELPEAVRVSQSNGITPVDMAQSPWNAPNPKLRDCCITSVVTATGPVSARLPALPESRRQEMGQRSSCRDEVREAAYRAKLWHAVAR